MPRTEASDSPYRRSPGRLLHAAMPDTSVRVLQAELRANTFTIGAASRRIHAAPQNRSSRRVASNERNAQQPEVSSLRQVAEVREWEHAAAHNTGQAEIPSFRQVPAASGSSREPCTAPFGGHDPPAGPVTRRRTR